jgi:HAMP domain-containing protein
MLDIQRQERTYRIFGNAADRDAITRLITRADSILETIRPVIPESERDTITELAGKLDTYSGSFTMLAAYIAENPPDVRLQKLSSKPGTDTAEFETMYRKYRSQLQAAPPALRDSLLAEAVKYIDIFSIDRIIGSPGSSGKAGQTSLLQQSLDTSRREFIAAANQFAAWNWKLMEEHKEESLKIEARAKRNIIFALILTAVIGGFMIVLLPRRIVKPISTLSALIRMTGNGEKDVELPVLPDDEIGELASAYSATVERMRHLDDLKTKRIASQKRFIERLLDYLDVPVCILTRNFAALYMNSLFTRLFGASLQQKIPEGGLDFTAIPDMRPFVEEIRKKTAQVPGDFTFIAKTPGVGEATFRGRPVRNAALNLETILVVGAPVNPEKG